MSGLIVLGALCALIVAEAVAGATPLAAGPVTSLPAARVAVAQGQPTNTGEATVWALGGRAVWEVTDAVAFACRSPRTDLAHDAFSDGFLPCGGSAQMVVLEDPRQDLMIGANPAAPSEPWTLPSG